jgi:hypothetical protein
MATVGTTSFFPSKTLDAMEMVVLFLPIMMSWHTV